MVVKVAPPFEVSNQFKRQECQSHHQESENYSKQKLCLGRHLSLHVPQKQPFFNSMEQWTKRISEPRKETDKSMRPEKEKPCKLLSIFTSVFVNWLKCRVWRIYFKHRVIGVLHSHHNRVSFPRTRTRTLLNPPLWKIYAWTWTHMVAE